jgi:hypothetical protein
MTSQFEILKKSNTTFPLSLDIPDKAVTHCFLLFHMLVFQKGVLYGSVITN